MPVFLIRIDKLLDQFSPYCLSEKSFPLDTVKEALGEDYQAPPPITPEYLARLMNYAVENNFGMGKKGKKNKIAVDRTEVCEVDHLKLPAGG